MNLEITTKAVKKSPQELPTPPDSSEQYTNDQIITQDTTFAQKLDTPQITFRSTIAGLLIGSIVLISNFQFGLQTGWVSMMSLPSSLLGFALFKYTGLAKDFTDVENVFVQSVAVAVGTGPLAYGLIGIVPALEKFMTSEESGLGRKIQFSFQDLVIWSTGLALFGVFFAAPLRKQVIVKEKLPFPSGSATATLISVLHKTELNPELKEEQIGEGLRQRKRQKSPTTQESTSVEVQDNLLIQTDTKITTLVYTFLVSALYTLVSFFIPVLKKLPIFGTTLSETYKWDFQPSPAYIGQGMIMGLPTVSYMLFGAILGWGILAPLAKYQGWAPGAIDDWVNGGQGWILWISLSVMIADSLVLFVAVSIKSLWGAYLSSHQLQDKNLTDESTRLLDDHHNEDVELGAINPSSLVSTKTPQDSFPEKHLVSLKVSILGVIALSILCASSLRFVFGDIVPYYALIVAIILALFFSILGVRALGETDLNPVSGIGKLSQLIFAGVIPRNHPSKILINLVAGGVAEAGAQQAGDLMQDLKTGHLIGASPKAQFIAQLIGTFWSIFMSSAIYLVYNKVYHIPNDVFRVPTAIIWIDCSRLVTGEGLPPKAFEFLILFGAIFTVISILKNTVPQTSKFHKYLVYLPSGVAVGVGIYNTPNFTLARFLGGAVSYWWINNGSGKQGKIGMIIFSSGLVLGEGLLSVVTMALTSLGIQPL